MTNDVIVVIPPPLLLLLLLHSAPSIAVAHPNVHLIYINFLNTCQ